LVATARPRTRTTGAAVRPGGVQDAARQHHRRQRQVGAAVDDHVDVDRDDRAVGGEAEPVAHPRGWRLVVAAMSSSRS
jgi:hypothetical protein